MERNGKHVINLRGYEITCLVVQIHHFPSDTRYWCPPFHSFTPGMWCNGNMVSLKRLIHGSIPWLANSQIPFQVWETSRYKVGIRWHSYRPNILGS